MLDQALLIGGILACLALIGWILSIRSADTKRDLRPLLRTAAGLTAVALLSFYLSQVLTHLAH
jgi:hypothetical protein